MEKNVLKNLWRVKLNIVILILVSTIGSYSLITNSISHLTQTYGIVFNKIDPSIIYRFFTMMVLVNNSKTFYGILTFFILLSWAEYLMGTKKFFLLMVVGNIAGLVGEYILIYKMFGFSNYTDVALSNGGFAVLGGFAFYLKKELAVLLFIGILIFFVYTSFTSDYLYTIAHLSGLLAGLSLELYLRRRAELKMQIK